MNDVENFWEELSDKAQKVNVNEEMLTRHNQIRVKNIAAKHEPGCCCGYCDPVDPIKASERKPSDPLTPTPEDFCAFFNAHYQEAKPGDEEYYEGMTGEELEQFANYVKATDKCLPPLDHPNIADDKKLGEALSKYYTFIEGKKTEMDRPTLEGILVFHIDVGQLSPEKAEAFVDRMKDRVKEVTDRMPPTWDILWLPQRCQGTRIEVIRF